MLSNHVKRALKLGQTSTGTWLTTGDSLAAELLATAGFDWIVVDTENTLIDAHALSSSIQAIGRYRVAPLVRVAVNTDETIQRALAAGAWGIVAPNVRSRDEAEHVVRAAKYPPQGRRGLGGPRAGLSFMTDPLTYFDRANDELMVIVQIEDIAVLSRLDEILSVPGIDACYLGMYDLCASMGLSPSAESANKDVEAAIQAILKAALRNGICPGLHATRPEYARMRVAEGWRLIGMGDDVSFMTLAAKTTLDQFRNGDDGKRKRCR